VKRATPCENSSTYLPRRETRGASALLILLDLMVTHALVVDGGCARAPYR
jgi:hypothetical protein